MVSYISWVILGLIVGVLAKWLMPGKDPGGCFITVAIGIAGAFLGGFIGTQLGLGSVTGVNIVSIGLATGGAMILLFIYRILK